VSLRAVARSASLLTRIAHASVALQSRARRRSGPIGDASLDELATVVALCEQRIVRATHEADVVEGFLSPARKWNDVMKLEIAACTTSDSITTHEATTSFISRINLATQCVRDVPGRFGRLTFGANRSRGEASFLRARLR
jgi:hypothetical protein